MGSINRVVLVGRLTKDVEIRKTQSGLSVAQFTVAVDRRYSKDEEQTADFINCVAWRQSADYLGSYSHKGSQVGIEGRIQTRNYDGQDGKRVYVTEVVCDSVCLLGSNGNSTAGTGTQSTQPQQNQQNKQNQQTSKNNTDDVWDNPSMIITSDELPF